MLLGGSTHGGGYLLVGEHTAVDGNSDWLYPLALINTHLVGCRIGQFGQGSRVVSVVMASGHEMLLTGLHIHGLHHGELLAILHASLHRMPSPVVTLGRRVARHVHLSTIVHGEEALLVGVAIVEPHQLHRSERVHLLHPVGDDDGVFRLTPRQRVAARPPCLGISVKLHLAMSHALCRRLTEGHVKHPTFFEQPRRGGEG